MLLALHTRALQDDRWLVRCAAPPFDAAFDPPVAGGAAPQGAAANDGAPLVVEINAWRFVLARLRCSGCTLTLDQALLGLELGGWGREQWRLPALWCALQLRMQPILCSKIVVSVRRALAPPQVLVQYLSNLKSVAVSFHR